MKIWTYLEMYNKFITDNDLADEKWATPDEVAGYFNEAFDEIKKDIADLNKDYFLTKYLVPIVQGTGSYNLPDNMLINKIRGMIYANGSVIYPIMRYRGANEFQNIAFTDQYGTNDDYNYLLKNDYPGQAQFEMHPVARETAIYPPQAGAFTPVYIWYLRDIVRVPIIGTIGTGEFCNPEVLAPSQVNTGTNVITVNAGTSTYGIKAQGVVGGVPGSVMYINGDQIKFTAGPGGTVPGGLTAGTVYYVVNASGQTIKVAATLGGSAITLTTQGTVFFTISVAATTAIRNAILIDIPDANTFLIQWAKCRVLSKEHSPILSTEVDMLLALKKSVVDILTNNIPDNDDEVTPDFSHYQEQS